MSASTRPDDFARVDYTCKKYKAGHQVHWIQAKISRRDGALATRAIDRVDDDGTIYFTDGTTTWNHDPDRVRALVDGLGPGVVLRHHSVLAIGSYLVSVSDVPDPCDARGRVEGESLTDELLRRGGIFRPGREVLEELDIDADRGS